MNEVEVEDNWERKRGGGMDAGSGCGTGAEAVNAGGSKGPPRKRKPKRAPGMLGWVGGDEYRGVSEGS